METFLIKRHSTRAVFKRNRSLYTQHLKEIERLAFQGQTAARMGIIISLYSQQALALLLQELGSEKPNIDKTIQTVRDVFATSTKILDQFGRSGAFDHLIWRKSTLVDIGLDSVKDVARQTDLLPLSGDGVLGKEFEIRLKERKEKNKEFKELVPEIFGRRDFSANLKRKAPSTSFESKQMGYDNPKTSRPYSQRRSDFSSPRYNYRNGGSYQKTANQQNKSLGGVSCFPAQSKTN